MPAQEVLSYYARWNPVTHKGYVTMTLAPYGSYPTSKTLGESNFTGPEEFRLVCEMLRVEKPVYWDSIDNRLFVSAEPVGEEET